MAEALEKCGAQIDAGMPAAWPRQPDGTFNGLRVKSTETESDTMGRVEKTTGMHKEAGGKERLRAPAGQAGLSPFPSPPSRIHAAAPLG